MCRWYSLSSLSMVEVQATDGVVDEGEDATDEGTGDVVARVWRVKVEKRWNSAQQIALSREKHRTEAQRTLSVAIKPITASFRCTALRRLSLGLRSPCEYTKDDYSTEKGSMSVWNAVVYVW